MASSHWVYTKKKSYGYNERREEERQIYLGTLKHKDPTSLVYLDESGIDDNETNAYAWGARGIRIQAMKNSNRKKRLSMIAALHTRKIKAPFVFEGSCTRKVFETYVEKVLLPALIHGQTVIMDNASFHKGGKIRAMIENAGCQVLYLPAYSPDFNPIEHYWAAIKYRIRYYLQAFNRDLFAAASYAFRGY